MKWFVLLAVLVFASKNENDAENAAANSGEKIMENTAENSIVVKIEEDEYAKKKRKGSGYIGVCYDGNKARWVAKRWTKTEKKKLLNGYHKDEETAAHASDTLARKLLAKGEQNHKLNFPDDNTVVEKTKSSKFIGVCYDGNKARWVARRWSSSEKNIFTNGYHKYEETAAHASDTLARKLLKKGEQGHKLNFPDDNTEVEKTKSSKYFGVTYIEKRKKWYAHRWSKTEKKLFSNGYHRDEETAAFASDTLARKLLANGDHYLKLNCPDDNTEVYAKKYQTNKRKISFDLDAQTDENEFDEFEQKEK